MKILVPTRIAERLQDELRRAGRKEIGGLLMGEHVADDLFRIVDISVQRSGGNAACFIRHPREHKAQLDAFFEQTRHNYQHFNYLGEWHSHPSFAPIPSPTDTETMQSIVLDPDVGANFLILLIPKLVRHRVLELSATIFHRVHGPAAAEIEFEVEAASVPAGDLCARVIRVFKSSWSVRRTS